VRASKRALVARPTRSTGKLVDGPISADVPVYEVRVEGDTVFVKW
jgi:nitrite reductase/ring-hydroxylating ferredoxin subunit